MSTQRKNILKESKINFNLSYTKNAERSADLSAFTLLETILPTAFLQYMTFGFFKKVLFSFIRR